MQLKLRTLLLPLFVVAFTFFTSIVQAQTVNAYADKGLALPTVSSDKDDYAPGEIAHIRGTGWTLDDTVDVHFEEDPYHDDDHHYHGIVVNKDGSWQIDYPIEERHLGVKFTVHVEGKQSGYEGLAYFTDAQNTVTTLVSSSNPSIVGGSISFTSGVTRGGGGQNNTVVGRIDLSIDGIVVKSFDITAGDNIGKTFTTSDLAVGEHTVIASFIGSTNAPGYNNSQASITQIIKDKTNPVISWSNPSTITYGTALSATQLNASADVNGTFAYSPASGTVLGAGTNQTLSVTFTPTNTTNYNTVSKSVTINVDKANQAISWSNPTAIDYGTTLSSTQLNATVTTGNGGLTYTPASGTKLDAGTHTLSVTAAETDNYKPATATVSLTVNKATPTISWATPDGIEYGTLLSATQLNASAGGVAGSFTYTPGAGTLLNAGNSQLLTASFVPNDTKNYNTPADKTVTINVAKANATVNVTGYSGQYDAAAHGATGSASGINGTDVSSGLSLGSTFTDVPGGIANWTFNDPNYNTQSGSVNITISKAPVTLSFGNLVFDYDGAEKVVTASASPNVSGIVVSGAGTNAGEYAASASLVNTNYEAAPISGTLKINRINATINVSGYTGTYDGTSHGATGTAKDLNGNNLSGLDLGSSYKDYPGGAASWSFAGTTNYLPASGSVAITISKATPSISLSIGGPYTYNGNPQGVQSATVSGVLINGVEESLGDASVTYAGSNTPPTNAGNYDVISSFAGNTNYTAAANQTGSLVIDKATATITLSNLNQTYDGDEKTVTSTTTPFGLSVVTTYAGSATAPKNAGSYAINSSINDNNYKGSATGSLVIAKAPTTTTVSVVNKTYNGDSDAGSASVTGVADLNEQLTITYIGTGSTSYGPSATAPINAGSYSATATYLESANYLTSTDTKPFTIAKADAVISIVPYSNVYDGAAHTATGSATGVKGENMNSSISFASSYTNVPGGPTTWSFNGGANYNDDNGSTNVSISKANQTINWASPAAITYGDLLTASQLNASAAGVTGGSATGSLTYAPASGTLLNAGTHTLKVTAAATDNYYEATEEVSLTVDKATQVISWSAPANIAYPEALGTNQLNAIVNGVAGGSATGGLSYSPATGTVLGAGEHTLSVTAAATDNYYSATKIVTLVVDKGTPVITWNNPAGIVYGTALTGAQLNAAANIAGTLSYTPAGNTFLNAGNGQTLSVDFTPTDLSNYNAISKNVTINVAKANPVITVNGYTGIYDGSAHGASLVAATGGRNEDLSTMVNLGSNFTNVPGDNAQWSFAGDDNHNAANGSVAITINKATPSISLTVGGPYTYDGNTHTVQNAVVNGVTINGAVQSLGNASVTYNNISTAPKGAGTYNVSASYAGSGNYEPVTESGTLKINAAKASVTPDAKSKYCGQGDPTFTGTLLGFVAADNVTAAYSVSSTTISATLSPSNVLGNYDISYNTATLTINGVTIDASACSTPVAYGATATLSAKVSPTVAGVSVTFYQDNVAKPAVYTNADGIATLQVSGLAVDVYKITAVAGSGCNESIAYLPVYDPNAGFVTGGGWINSPAGAYVSGPTLTGKANFGFVSKYKKGSTQVDGSTEFQFQAGSLNFKSLLHESGSLVIAGSKAMYKGTGTINGVSGYSFMVSAIDGGYNGGTAPDRFRIKIWNTTTSAIIYDNQIGTDDNATLGDATTIGGGSIVIQQTTTKKSEIVTTQVAEQTPAVVNFGLSVLPNPTTSVFNVKVEGNNTTEKISLKVVDMYGRMVQVFNNLQNGQSLQIGNTYRPGVYIVEMIQGNNRKQLKVIKQNN